MSLGELFRKMDEAYQSACAFFGEKHKHTDPNDFFTAITAFIENFKVSIRMEGINVTHCIKHNTLLSELLHKHARDYQWKNFLLEIYRRE